MASTCERDNLYSGGMGRTRESMLGMRYALRHGHTSKDPRTGRPVVSPTYKSWQAMKYRCAKRTSYAGVTVCRRWLSFSNFLADMGVRPGPEYSIDRIDTTGNYEPGNCKWATRSEQQRNKRPMPNQPNQYRRK